MSRKASTPVFPTFAASHRLFLRFRFAAHSFVTALSSYVYDTAIRSNFDPFLAALSQSQEAATSHPQFTDAFSLADYHSSVMDDILSACLLRSGQKSVGDLLRGSLEIILEFGLLMSDVVAGRLQEYQAVSRLEDLFKQYRNKLTTLVCLLYTRHLWCFLMQPLQVKVLSALVERGTMAGRSSAEAQLPGSNPGSRVNDCLADLLVRIDIADWWRGSGNGVSTE